MDQNDKFKRKLNALEVPEELENRIRSNWHSQMRGSNSGRVKNEAEKIRFWRPGLALAASLLIAFFVSTQPFKTPALIDAAVNDILKDAKTNIGLSISLETVLAMHDIQLPPMSMPISMTKFCTLDGLKTTHMQVNGADKGEVHFFIKQGEFDIAFWQANQGEVATMPWKLIKPGKDLSVLVLYSVDMNPENVAHLIQKMFFA